MLFKTDMKTRVNGVENVEVKIVREMLDMVDDDQGGGYEEEKSRLQCV